MSAVLDAIKRAELRDVRDELLRRARTCEAQAAQHLKAAEREGVGRSTCLWLAADASAQAATFREAADLADLKLRGGAA